MGMSISNRNCLFSIKMCVCIGICRNVGCPLVILEGARLGVRCQQCARASSVDPVTGKTCGDSIPEMAASMYSMVCVETVQR